MLGNFNGITPGFYIYAGNMCGGKTARLILDLQSISHAGLKMQVFRTSWDNRYEEGFITANNKELKFPATSVSNIESLVKKTNPDTKILGIDELQFWDDEILEFIKKYKNKMRIISTCLIKDFRGNEFPLRNKKDKKYDSHITTSDLIKISEEDSLNNKGGVIYLEPLCLHNSKNQTCGKIAPYIQRWRPDKTLSRYSDPTIKLGVADKKEENKETYAPRCIEHFIKPEPTG